MLLRSTASAAVVVTPSTVSLDSLALRPSAIPIWLQLIDMLATSMLSLRWVASSNVVL